MAQTFTIGQITGSIRTRGDLDDDMNEGYDDAFISSNVLIDFIDSAYAEAYDIMIDADPDRFVTTTTVPLGGTTSSLGSQISLDDGQARLPDDMYRLRAVDFKISSDNVWRRSDRYELAEREMFEYDSSAITNPYTAVRYRLAGEYINVQPPVDGDIRMTYIPIPTRISSSSQTINNINGLPELTILLSLRRCRIRSQESVSEIDAEIRRQTDRLRSAAASRDRGSPRYLEDPRVVRLGRLYRRR
jgi:hypothetical protein